MLTPPVWMLLLGIPNPPMAEFPAAGALPIHGVELFIVNGPVAAWARVALGVPTFKFSRPSGAKMSKPDWPPPLLERPPEDPPLVTAMAAAKIESARSPQSALWE